MNINHHRILKLRYIYIYIFISVLNIRFQIRLDFSSFVITGPSTATATIGKALGGNINDDSGKEYTLQTQCL